MGYKEPTSGNPYKPNHTMTGTAATKCGRCDQPATRHIDGYGSVCTFHYFEALKPYVPGENPELDRKLAEGMQNVAASDNSAKDALNIHPGGIVPFRKVGTYVTCMAPESAYCYIENCGYHSPTHAYRQLTAPTQSEEWRKGFAHGYTEGFLDGQDEHAKE